MIRIFRAIQYNLVSKLNKNQVFYYCRPQSSSATVQNFDDGFKEKFSANFNLDKQNALEDSFKNIDSIPSLLKTATLKNRIEYVFKAIGLLADWSKTKKIDFKEVEEDENYMEFVSVIERKGIYMPVSRIIKALKDLQTIGLPSESFLIESLENDLLWNMKKVSASTLLLILQFQHQYVETERQKKVMEEAIMGLEAQWSDLTKSRDFQIIYSMCNIFSAEFMKTVEDHLAEQAAELNIWEIADIFVAISHSKRRPVSLLRTLGYQMFKYNDKLPPQKIKNVLFAMDTLSFHDDAVLGKLSSDFLDQIKNIMSPSIIGSFTFCVGRMYWKDTATLNGLATWVIDNINICTPSVIVNLIITLATLNHIPENIDELIRTCIPELNFNLMSNSNIVNLVWALTLLDQVTEEQIAKVLEPSFVSQFSIDDPSCVGSYLKILNINAASELIFTSYSGPKLQLNSKNVEKLSLTRSREDVTLHDRALKIFHKFLPPPKYLRENIKTTFGFTVDAELIVDKNSKPLDLTDYPSYLVGHSETKVLPEGAHKVAIMIWNYKDYNKGLFSLTGPNEFAVKLLNKQGYKVVQIPYNEVSKHEKSLRAVQNFEEKIKKSLQM